MTLSAYPGLRTSLVAMATLTALPAPALAADDTEQGDGFSIEGSVRARVERIENEFRPGKLPDETIWSSRTLVKAEYASGPVRFVGELQDARAYGIDPGSTAGISTVNALEPIQAYVAADLGEVAGSLNGSLQLGRFTMKQGSGRLVGRVGFSNVTTSFTGAQFAFEGVGGDKISAFWTMPQERRPSDTASIRDNEFELDREGTDLQLFGSHYQTKLGRLGATLELYGYGLLEDDRSDRATRNRRLYTPGLRFVRKPKQGAIDFDFEAAYQLGTIRTSKAVTAPKQDVSAWMLHAEVGHSLSSPSTGLHIAALFDAASGDGQGNDYTRFDSLFGGRRSTFGQTANFGPLSFANIISPGLRLSAKPDKPIDGSVSARLAWLQSAKDSFAKTGVKDPSGSVGRFAGTQIEGSLGYWIVPKVLRFGLGGAYLSKGRFLEEAANAPATGDTRYVFSDVTFSF
ncbi:alginate export family protein [Qipengyuania sp. 483]